MITSMKHDIVISIHKDNEFSNKMKNHLSENYNMVEKSNIKQLIQESRLQHISCVILHVVRDIPGKINFKRFKKLFPSIPCIAVIVPKSIELARYCGTLGIESVLQIEEIEHIGNEIDRVCTERNNKVSFNEITILNGIDRKKCSTVIREALSIMEQEYVGILNINEVADLMEISECTLSREFVKYALPGPKKILMYLKVHQAIKLMRNSGLNVREISSLSGFTDEKRMAECFKRIYGMPPGKYRLRHMY